MSELLAIGELSERTGVAPSALRYYEELGLLVPARRDSGRRRYPPTAVEAVGLIRLLQEVGFTLAEVAALRAARTDGPGGWRNLVAAKLADLDELIARAQVARVALDHALRCPHEHILDCPTLWDFVAARLAGTRLDEVEPGRVG